MNHYEHVVEHGIPHFIGCIICHLMEEETEEDLYQADKALEADIKQERENEILN